MYTDFYNLASLPFENTPDPRFFYACEQHREALAAIEYTIRMRKGFVMVTGLVGSGKTTVGRTMVERCADQAQIVQVLHGHRTRDELLRQVLRSLGVDYRAHDDHAHVLEHLQAYLREQANSDRPIVLIVDEAQTLTDEALEELRLLSNFDTATQKLIQIVLIGQPELRQRVRSPNLSALRQRIVMAKQLRPMSVEQTDEYIAHRLNIACADTNKETVTFTEKAVAEIYKFSGGVPRLINFVCDNCLLLGYVRQINDQITQTMVRQVIDDMLPSLGEGNNTQPQIVTEPQVADRMTVMNRAA